MSKYQFRLLDQSKIYGTFDDISNCRNCGYVPRCLFHYEGFSNFVASIRRWYAIINQRITATQQLYPLQLILQQMSRRVKVRCIYDYAQDKSSTLIASLQLQIWRDFEIV